MKKVLSAILILSLLLVVGCGSQGKKEANFPTKPIQLIVPYAPGGGNDVIARALEVVIPKYLPNGQTIVVINKAGGSTVVGMTELFKSKPDGYTIGIIAGAPLSVIPHYGNTPYKDDSFQPIIRVATNPTIIAVKADAPWKNFDEWLDYVKKKPGEYTYSTGGAGSAPQLAIESLCDAAQIKLRHVPFNGAGPAAVALLGGQVMGFAGSPQEAKSQIEAGQLRIIANLGSSKSDYYKDAQMVKEKGFNVAGDNYFGIIAPKNVPKDVVAILHNAFKKALADPEVIKSFKNSGIQVDYAGPDDLQKQITDYYNKNGKVLKAIGLIK